MYNVSVAVVTAVTASTSVSSHLYPDPTPPLDPEEPLHRMHTASAALSSPLATSNYRYIQEQTSL